MMIMMMMMTPTTMMKMPTLLTMMTMVEMETVVVTVDTESIVRIRWKNTTHSHILPVFLAPAEDRSRISGGLPGTSGTSGPRSQQSH